MPASARTAVGHGLPTVCFLPLTHDSLISEMSPSFLPWDLFTAVSPRAVSRLGKDGRELSLSPMRECVLCGEMCGMGDDNLMDFRNVDMRWLELDYIINY